MITEINGTLVELNPNEIHWLSLERFGNMELWERSDKKEYEVQINFNGGRTIHVTPHKQTAIQLFNQLKQNGK